MEAKDKGVQQNIALMQQQVSEKDEHNSNIRRKNEEIEHLGGQIVQQQTAIQELEAKLPSRDIMQVRNIFLDYGLRVYTVYCIR